MKVFGSILFAGCVAMGCTGLAAQGPGAASGTQPQSPASPTAALTSPDGQLATRFSVQPSPTLGENGSGKLMYSVAFHGKQVIDNSALGLELDDYAPLGSNVTITGTEPGSGIDDYSLANTKVSHVHDQYNSILIHVMEPSPHGRRGGRTMTVEARAYNNGVAFRYVLDRQPAIPSLHLRGEGTEFRFSEDDTAWVRRLTRRTWLCTART